MFLINHEPGGNLLFLNSEINWLCLHPNSSFRFFSIYFFRFLVFSLNSFNCWNVYLRRFSSTRKGEKETPGSDLNRFNSLSLSLIGTCTYLSNERWLIPNHESVFPFTVWNVHRELCKFSFLQPYSSTWFKLSLSLSPTCSLFRKIELNVHFKFSEN